jgi:hypothetical protein
MQDPIVNWTDTPLFDFYLANDETKEDARYYSEE